MPALELYGSLIVAILGIVSPILTILISLFPNGVKALATKYENEKKQSEENIIHEAQKKESGKGLDYGTLGKTLATLKKRKRQAEIKLSYLRPTQFVVRVSTPFITAFIGVIIAAQSPIHSLQFIIALVSSAVAFLAGLCVLWMVLRVLVEVTEIVNQAKISNDEKIIELLSILVDRSPAETPFIEEAGIKAKFNNKFLKESETFEFSVNRKYEIPVSIENSSNRMAKKVELGLIFPKDFLVESTPNLSIFTDEKSQIVRFNREIIQAQENNLQGEMSITFLKVGEFKVDTFIKGENIKHHRFSFTLKVIE